MLRLILFVQENEQEKNGQIQVIACMWERKKRTQNVVWRKVMGIENPVEIKILEGKYKLDDKSQIYI